MQTERLKGHSCVHCQEIVLPGSIEEIQRDERNLWDAPPGEMHFKTVPLGRLGVSLADLERKADSHCEFADYLHQRIKQIIHKQPDTKAVQLFTILGGSSGRLYIFALVHLGDIHNSLTTAKEADLDGCYVSASMYPGRSKGNFECNLTAEEGDNIAQFVDTTPRIARQPLSEQTVFSIQEWIKRCRDERNGQHKICSLSESQFVPSRLVEIEPSASGIRLRLVHGSGVHRYDTSRYSALSYCWGYDEQPQRLTRVNLHSYERDIPWDNLPKTLQDAAIATNLLGIHYVWIDSLCIVQDDQKDKETEIGQMTKVYSHATFTIMARRGNKVTDGFLHARKPPSATSYLPFRADNGQQGWVTLTFRSALISEEDTALDKRGWVMQESVLSRRCIVFGTWYTEWSCRKERRYHSDGWRQDFTGRRRNGDPFEYPRWGEHDSLTVPFESQSVNERMKGSSLTDAIMFLSANPEYEHSRPADHVIQRTWHRLIEAYSHLLLSRGEDRVLAISGMAERFAPTICQSKSYIAGIWEYSVPFSLLWQSNRRFPPVRPLTYQGPSWSWVSVNIPIMNIDGDSRKCLCKVPSIRYVLSDPGAPYGAVRSAELHIEGPALSMQWHYIRHHDDVAHFDPRIGGTHDVCRWRWREKEDEEWIDPEVGGSLDAREDNTEWADVVWLAIAGQGHVIEGIILIMVKDNKDNGVIRNRDQYRRLGHFRTFSDTVVPPIHNTGAWPLRSFVVI